MTCSILVTSQNMMETLQNYAVKQEPKKEAREILIDKAHSYVWGITKVKK